MRPDSCCRLVRLLRLLSAGSRLRFPNRYTKGRPSCVALYLESSDRLLEFLAPYERCLRQGRIGEMRRVMNPRAIFLSLNFEFEICGQALKIGDHCLKLVNLPMVLVNVKIPQAKGVNLPTPTVNAKIFQVKELCTGIHCCASSEVATLFGFFGNNIEVIRRSNTLQFRSTIYLKR